VRRYFVVPVLIFLVPLLQAQGKAVERLDPELDRIVDSNAVVETAAEGFGFTEGPVWMHAGYVLFTDVPGNVIRTARCLSSCSMLAIPEPLCGAMAA
jgi:hypothetical protein